MSDYTPACYAMFKDGKIEYSEMCVSGCADDFDMSDYPEDEGFEVVALYSEDAITTLEARNKELETDKEQAQKVAEAYHQAVIRSDEKYEARIAALESGQPCEVNGVLGQFVRKALTPATAKPLEKMLTNCRTIGESWAEILTASAAEMKEQTK